MAEFEVSELPVAEKLRLMEFLWDSLSRDAAGEAIVPEWHQSVLAERAGRIDSGQEPSSPWNEAKQRLRQQTS
jgi:putative addiction module component (TIGR02574 family)